jgi:chromosome segregation ATPase
LILLCFSLDRGLVVLQRLTDSESETSAEEMTIPELERNLRDQLQDLRAGLIQTQNIQNQLAELQTVNATFQERCVTKDQQISELRERLDQHHEELRATEEKLERADRQAAHDDAVATIEVDRLRKELHEEREKFRRSEDGNKCYQEELTGLREELTTQEAKIVGLVEEKQELEHKVSNIPENLGLTLLTSIGS